jgi:hypothetical protein
VTEHVTLNYCLFQSVCAVMTCLVFMFQFQIYWKHNWTDPISKAVQNCSIIATHNQVKRRFCLDLYVCVILHSNSLVWYMNINSHNLLLTKYHITHRFTVPHVPSVSIIKSKTIVLCTHINKIQYLKLNSVVVVRKRTIPTERPPLSAK